MSSVRPYGRNAPSATYRELVMTINKYSLYIAHTRTYTPHTHAMCIWCDNAKLKRNRWRSRVAVGLSNLTLLVYSIRIMPQGYQCHNYKRVASVRKCTRIKIFYPLSDLKARATVILVCYRQIAVFHNVKFSNPPLRSMLLYKFPHQY